MTTPLFLQSGKHFSKYLHRPWGATWKMSWCTITQLHTVDILTWLAWIIVRSLIRENPAPMADLNPTTWKTKQSCVIRLWVSYNITHFTNLPPTYWLTFMTRVNMFMASLWRSQHGSFTISKPHNFNLSWIVLSDYNCHTGREMHATKGHEFTGYWPVLFKLKNVEKGFPSLVDQASLTSHVTNDIPTKTITCHLHIPMNHIATMILTM